ncbi:MAG: phosphoribosylformylglycinamidine cyclo-ligase, partial [Actinomycetota bacterium]
MTRGRSPGRPGLTYAQSGVDIAAGERAVEMIKAHVRSTFRPEVVGDIGGFGGLFSLGRLEHTDPMLVSSTDGVGTKSMLATLTGRYDTIGIDCVAMSADDIATLGAEPLFFLDYISVGRLVPEQVDAIVSGVARGCRDAGCALIGGEMSEHPGLLEPGEFDIVGFAVGVVDRRAVGRAAARHASRPRTGAGWSDAPAPTGPSSSTCFESVTGTGTGYTPVR